MKKTLPAFLALLALAVLPAAKADDDAPPKSGRQHDYELGQISVIDKFLAVEAAIGSTMKPPRHTEDQWAKDYEDLYLKYMRNGQLSSLPGAGANDAINALTLGIKASDAVIALKARDVSGLNQAAEQIEQLAIKLGATKQELGMADTVKRYANNGRWIDSFLALGFLQRNVLNYLKEHGDKKPQATLVIIGGWLQGGRCVTHVIDEHYDPVTSNILREPRLVDLIKRNMDELPPALADEPIVKKIAAALPDIKTAVNVGFHDPVKQDAVKALNKTFESLVLEIAPDGPKKKD